MKLKRKMAIIMLLLSYTMSSLNTIVCEGGWVGNKVICKIQQTQTKSKHFTSVNKQFMDLKLVAFI